MSMNRLAFDCEVKLAGDGGETGTIEGYGSVYNVVDRGGDIVVPGAFKKSLAEWRKRKALPPMLWQHDSWTPIGKWTAIEEDEKGLKVTGELVLEVPAASQAHALARAGVVKGLSIGYATKQASFDRQTGIRSIKEAELIEVSLVTFPMNQDATISGVKGDFDPRAWGTFQHVLSGASGAYASSNPADRLIDLIFEVKAGYRQNAGFLMSRRTVGATRKLKDGQGNYLVDLRLRDGALVESIFGFPVTDGEDMPALAAGSLSVAFGDFNEAYTIVDRLGVSVVRDNITQPGFVKYHMRKRVGGGAVNFEAVKFLKFAAS